MPEVVEVRLLLANNVHIYAHKNSYFFNLKSNISSTNSWANLLILSVHSNPLIVLLKSIEVTTYTTRRLCNFVAPKYLWHRWLNISIFIAEICNLLYRHSKALKMHKIMNLSKRRTNKICNYNTLFRCKFQEFYKQINFRANFRIIWGNILVEPLATFDLFRVVLCKFVAIID